MLNSAQMQLAVGVVVLLSLVFDANALLSDKFRAFLRSKYGAAVEKELTRSDMGIGGSFGGGRHNPAQKTRLAFDVLVEATDDIASTQRSATRIMLSKFKFRRPAVILVHGITNTAGSFARNHQFFLKHGYRDEEVYGTTYGDGGKTNVLFVTMNCAYVKVVRFDCFGSFRYRLNISLRFV